MPSYVVWIDQHEAKLFEFSAERMVRQSFRSDVHFKKDQINLQQQERRFFAEVAARLVGGQKMLILGPGMTKHHFQNYLVEQLPAMAKKIVSCETTDHPTDGQIAAFARKFLHVA